MKKYQSTWDGSIGYQEGAFDPEQKEFNKHLSVIGGEGDWKYLCGYKVFVDTDGVITKGYDIFIGKSYEDIKNLDEPTKFTVQLGLQSCLNNMRKADPLERSTDFTKAMNELSSFIDKRLADVKFIKAQRQALEVVPSHDGAVYSI